MTLSQIAKPILIISFVSTLVFLLFSIGDPVYISGHAGPPSGETFKRHRLYCKISFFVFLVTLILEKVS